ncbi:MAG: M43 family zinc metalloprotease [Cyclobacteriaceae bacterium]
MKPLLTITFLIFSTLSFAQKKNHPLPTKAGLSALHLNTANQVTASTRRNCYSVEMEEKLQKKYPNRLDTDAFERKFEKYIRESASKRIASEEIYRIPTIIHIVHNGETIGSGANVIPEQVYTQFDVLNEDFRRLGAGFNDHENGADIFVEFVPAATDPEGNTLAEMGINRIDGQKSFWEEGDIENDLKPTTIWDPEKYLNIWVLAFGGDLDGILGYAQFPSLSGLDGLSANEGPAETDGVVIGHPYFGTTGTAVQPFNGGRTATHEIGHWLGLRHIWGDGGCSIDDFCEDTPPAAAENFGCPDEDSCTSDEFPDMVENYMDYTNDACMNIFTQDQKARMRTVLEICPRRSTLIGPACEEAEVATIGNISTTPPLWYTYTATAQEVIKISSVGQTDENTTLSVYAECDGSAITENDDALGTEQSEITRFLNQNETVKIYWGASYSETEFSWTLSTIDAVEGSACHLAGTAAQGNNTMTATTLSTVWFKYTMQSASSKAIIDAGDHQVYAYSGDCNGLNLLGQSTSSLTVFEAGNYQEIYIAIEADGGDFSWTVNEVAWSQGEVCSMSIDAAEGTNNAPSTPYWFSFQMPTSGDLTISSEGASVSTYAQIYDECGGDLLVNNVAVGSGQSELTARYLDENTTVKIYWKNVDSSETFDWTLTVTEASLGESCQLPTTASVGTNTVPASQEDLYWAKFTMPEADQKLTITSSASANVGIVADCSLSELLSSGLSGLIITELVLDQEVIIVWETTGSEFDYEITLSDVEDGDICSAAIQAVEGTNSAAYAPRWYSFTMPEDADLIVSSVGLTTEDTFLEIYDACGGTLLDKNDDNGDDFQSQIRLSGLLQGDAVIIHWSASYSSAAFDWSLEVKTPEPGDNCDTAIAAVEGTNTASNAPKWFYFTMPKDGTLSLSSVGMTNEDTYVYALDGCSGNVLDENDDINDTSQSSLEVPGLLKGETVYIYWGDDYSSQGFDWSLSILDPRDGDNCINPITAVVGRNTVSTAPIWFTFTMPKSGDMKVSSIGTTTTDTYLQIFEGCDLDPIAEHDDTATSLQSEITVTGLEANDEVLIHWPAAYSDEGFNWNLTLLNVANQAPDISDQSFDITPDLTNGTTLGTVVASDADGDNITLTISSGNSQDIFELNEATGELVLVDKDKLDASKASITLTVEVSDGITSSSAKVTLNLHLLANKNSFVFTVFPNPTSYSFSIQLMTDSELESGILRDLSGKEVKQITRGEATVNVSDLNPGIYLLELRVDGQSRLEKVMVK